MINYDKSAISRRKSVGSVIFVAISVALCVAHRRGRRGEWSGTGGAAHRAAGAHGRWRQMTELLLQFLQLDLEISKARIGRWWLRNPNHHLIGGKHPCINRVSTILLVMQDFATIHLEDGDGDIWWYLDTMKWEIARQSLISGVWDFNWYQTLWYNWDMMRIELGYYGLQINITGS